MMNWLKKFWNWLKNLFYSPSNATKTPVTPPKPNLSDAEYESVLFALLEGVKKGRSWGSCQGFLISRKIKSDELAEWIEKKSIEWLENKDNYQKLGQDLGELGEIASGKLGNIAANVSSQLGVRGSELGNFQGNNLQNTELNPNLSETTTDEVQRLIDQSVEQYQRGEYQEAVNTLVTAIQQYPNDYRGWYFWGLLMYEFQQYEQAIASYDKALEIKPDKDEAWNNRGNALRQLGRLEDAIASWDKALEIKPHNDDAWYNRGNALRQLGRLEDAIASYDKALEIKPHNDDAWYNRGNALSNLGRFDEAIISYDKALEIKPHNDDAWYNRGAALAKLGRLEEAMASWDKALEIKPYNDEAWYNRGNVLSNLGRFDEAIASWDKALEIKPDKDDTWNNRGIALANLGRFDEAIASWDKALEIKPHNDDAWYNRGKGIALANLGRLEEAIASYDKALEIKPDYYLAWYNRGSIASLLTTREGEILRIQSQLIETVQLDLTNVSTQLINYFQSLETEDFRHLISFLQQPNSEKLIQFLYQSQLQSISRLNPELNERGYKGQLISYRYPLDKHIFKDSHPEGWGFLHHKIGVAQYEHQEYNNAINSYYCALETLTVEKFPELRLEVIQDLVKVYLAVGDEAKADDYLLQGLKLLNELLDKVPIADENQRLRIEAKFLTFRQLTVNVLLEKGEIIEALRNAELEKNRRLTHILEGYKTENELQKTSNIYPSYEQIQTLLTPNKAIIYWFNSPMGLITFILTQQNSPLIKGGWGGLNLEYKEVSRESIEQWIKEWDKDYKDYRHKKDDEIADKKDHLWRINITSRLERLKEILDIVEIEQDLQDIDELILIPHQDLHRLPLHSLFNDKNWTISYLPSLQIGLNLKQKQLNNNQHQSLLSIENPREDLISSKIESPIINTYFATIEPSITTIEDFKNVILNHTHFHFTGHGYYNFDDPKESFLEFENNSQLTAYEINQLNFNSYELITLAACETALNGQKPIDSEYVGLVSAFMKGGANCVVSTLWTVDETSSAWLMIYFYQQYNVGITPKIALKNAQQWLKDVTNEQLSIWLTEILEDKKTKTINPHIIELIKDEINKYQKQDPNIKPYEHPYYWLGFIVHQF